MMTLPAKVATKVADILDRSDQVRTDFEDHLA